ncbi:MAG: hypothetical protein ACTSX6_08100 [Candidatus Heimdallarchaeaceae archaeon]
MIKQICPICGLLINENESKKSIVILSNYYKIKSENYNSKGKILKFSFGEIQLDDYCSNCDLQRLKTFLVENSKTDEK